MWQREVYDSIHGVKGKVIANEIKKTELLVMHDSFILNKSFIYLL